MLKTDSEENFRQDDSPGVCPSPESGKKVCNLKYLNDIMGGKKRLIREVLDVFITQVPEELRSIREAILKTDYTIIRNFAHTMKSSVSIMGITVLMPILQEMEDLGTTASGIEKIKQLNHRLNSICEQAIEEIEKEKYNYE